jgi:hypothetical protein
LEDNDHFNPGEKKETLFTIAQDFSLEPYICSEIFLSKNVSSQNSDKLLLINDSIFSLPYMQDLMFLLAKFKSKLWCRDLLYIGHFYCKFIDKNR